MSLSIERSNFKDSLSLGRESQIDQIYLNTVDIFKSLDSYCIFTRFNCYRLGTKKLNLLNRKGVLEEKSEEVYIYIQDSDVFMTSISIVDRSIEVELKNDSIRSFNVKETKKLSLIIRESNELHNVTINDIDEVKLNGLYQSPIEKLELTSCGISQITDYTAYFDDDYFEGNKIDEVHLNNCIILEKSTLEIPRPLKLYVEECKFDTPLLVKSVYKRIHVTTTDLTIGDKNSGDILIEHVNVNLNFAGTNFSNITVKGSGINALTFDTFSNHGKINFINSTCSAEGFLKANKYTNHLTAYDSILDNINLHFFDLNTFRHIHFVNTNILGMQLFHYPERLVNYLDNLSMLPCIENERDFNINAKFTYNQLRLLAERNGDTDKSVEYRSREQNYLRRTKDNVGDELLLFLNELSNWHGRNWLLGVFFTLIAGLISFAGYQGSLGIFLFCDSNWSADYIRYIATYPKLQLDNYQAQGTVLTDLARIFGIIFMGYGVFQTIAAFRKYGKK
ncbi:hypothetical protein [Sphingobacterium tabacisoli]|uniref:Pentapeptide repeat-containing protein n=1 Tax=Sphingobacterium tabacisoli TaxID=2044855 RepID=A0ABW5L534_9SPHI|nr:hypothetical protein [Sphingobacterium tabacisoli]